MKDNESSTTLQTVLENRQSLKRHIPQLSELAEMVIGQEPGDDIQADLIGKLLRELQADLQDLLTLKIDAGYFEEIVDLALHFQPAVGQLQHDHEQLLVELKSMQLEAHEPDHLPRIGRLLHGWLTRFRELDLREIELIQNVWNVDVGTID